MQELSQGLDKKEFLKELNDSFVLNLIVRQIPEWDLITVLESAATYIVSRCPFDVLYYKTKSNWAKERLPRTPKCFAFQFLHDLLNTQREQWRICYHYFNAENGCSRPFCQFSHVDSEKRRILDFMCGVLEDLKRGKELPPMCEYGALCPKFSKGIQCENLHYYPGSPYLSKQKSYIKEEWEKTGYLRPIQGVPQYLQPPCKFQENCHRKFDCRFYHPESSAQHINNPQSSAEFLENIGQKQLQKQQDMTNEVDQGVIKFFNFLNNPKDESQILNQQVINEIIQNQPKEVKQFYEIIKSPQD